MSASTWRVGLRIARREAWRARWRSLLVIGLIGLPVFVLAVADICYRTWQLGPQERIVREIGAADAGMQWYGGGPVQQTPSAWLGATTTRPPEDPQATPSTARLLALLPAGSRLIVRRDEPAGIRIRTDAGLKYSQLIGLDYADPIAHGLVDQVRGRAPRTEHEVALTESLAKSVGLKVGDTMRLAQDSRTFTVVGIVRDAGHRQAQAAYTLPSAIAAQTGFGGDDTFLISTPAPMSWQQVRHLDTLGYVTLSRSAYLHPPPKSQIPHIDSGSSVSTDAVATATLIAGMALLEVVLLAGPAFAVGARRQRRDLALIAVVGGQRRDLRNVVLSTGVVLGVAAGVLSVAGAVVAAAIAVPTLGQLVDAVPGHFDLRPAELAAVALVSVVTALLAALFPARGAARTDVIAALAGRRGTVRTRKRVPLIGALVAGAGAAVAIGGASVSTGWTVILAGVVLVELGLIICTPALLGLVTRLGRLLPLSGRIALRDAGRNRSAAAPAVAAVMASVIGAVALAIGVASANDQDRRNYRASIPMHDAWVRLEPSQAADANEVADTLRTAFGAADVVVVRGASNSCTADEQTCTNTDIELAPGASRTTNGPVATRYRGGQLPSVVVDDGSGVRALFDTPVPAAVAALRAGKVVVVDSAAVHDGMVSLTASTFTTQLTPTPGPPVTPKTRQLTVAAIAVAQGFPATQAILPPSVATRLGFAVVPIGVLAQNDTAPTDHQQQLALGAVSRIDPALFMYVESGYHNPDTGLTLALVGAAAVIAVAAAVIATALANVDSRPDLITLGAVGASPRTRRLLSMSRAAVIAGIGTLVGVLAGFVPPTAWVHAEHRVASYSFSGSYFIGTDSAPQLRLVVPWPAIAAAVVGIPLAAALIAGLFSRSRLPSERPAE